MSKKPHYRLCFEKCVYTLDGRVRERGWCVRWGDKRTAYMVTARAACEQAAIGSFY